MEKKKDIFYLSQSVVGQLILTILSITFANSKFTHNLRNYTLRTFTVFASFLLKESLKIDIFQLYFHIFGFSEADKTVYRGMLYEFFN